MKRLLIFFCMAIMAFSACSRVDVEGVESSTRTDFSIVAELPEVESLDVDTKAYMRYTIRVSWTKGDKLSVINLSTGKVLGGQLIADKAGYSATFSGTLNGVVGTGDRLMYVYPALENSTSERTFESFNFNLVEQIGSTPDYLPFSVFGIQSVTSLSGVFNKQTLSFAFMTSLLQVTLADLPAGLPVESIYVTEVDANLTGFVNNGSISLLPSRKSGANHLAFNPGGNVTPEGTFQFFCSIPEQPATSRKIYVVAGGRFFVADFPSVSFLRGYSYRVSAVHFQETTSLPSFDMNPDATGNQLAWQNGESFKIGSRTFSAESSNLNVVHVSEDMTVNDATLINAVVFVEPDATLTIGPDAIIANTVFMSNDPETKATIAGTVHTDASTSNEPYIVFKDMIIHDDVSIILPMTGLSALIYDSCDFSDVQDGLFNSYTNNYLKSFEMKDCNWTASDDLGYMLNASSVSTSKYESISITGCTFHSSASDAIRTLDITKNMNFTSLRNVRICDNFFLNVKNGSPAMVYLGAAPSLNIERNHVYYSDDVELSDDFLLYKSTAACTSLTDRSNSSFASSGSANIYSYNSGHDWIETFAVASNPVAASIAEGDVEYVNMVVGAISSFDGSEHDCQRSGNVLTVLHSPTYIVPEMIVLPNVSCSVAGVASSMIATASCGDRTENLTFSYPDIVNADNLQSLSVTGAESGWEMVWADEFNGTDWDRDVWTRCPKDTPDWAKAQWPEDESLVQVSDGALVTWARKESDTSKGNNGYVTGGIWGKGLKGFNLGMDGVQGRIDVRVKLTDAKGYWPAIWMMPNPEQPWAFGGEINLMEHLNSENTAYSTLHWSLNEAGEDLKTSNSYSYMNRTQYHVFTVLILDDVLYICYDGAPKLQCAKSSYPDRTNLNWPWDTTEYYMILDSQLGGSWVGNPTGTGLPAHMDIDYVRYMVKR